MADDKKRKRVPIKMPEEVLRGVYANNLMVMHTKGEFVVDFLNVFPPQGSVNARVIIRPENMKRMVKAMQENIERYEARHGEIKPLAVESDEVPEYS